MKANEIHLMDNVLVMPGQSCSSVADDFKGRVGTVYAKKGDELLVTFKGGASACLLPSEVEVTTQLADRWMRDAR